VPGREAQHPRPAAADEQPRPARALNGASCGPNAPAEKWSRSSSADTPAPSIRRACSSQARPRGTDSLTTPNRISSANVRS